jgi:imidazolonepropionase-like amidohydrolase
MINEAAVPSIKLFVSAGFNSPETARELLSGAEEEGVPCELEAVGEEGAIALAYKAAGASVLGVGLGLDSAGMAAVHYDKLSEDKPLFTLNYRIDGAKLRSMASNAARLVKGLPFVL